MKKIAVIFSCLLIVFSCKKSPKNSIEQTEESIDSVPTEQYTIEEIGSVLDWEGSYVGILPCDDCEGRNTEVVLAINHTYTKSTLYMKTDKEEAIERGQFIWLDDGCTIILDDKDKTKLKVTLNTLTVLNSDGEPHKVRANEYKLQKNICEDKDFEEYIYKGSDGKKYTIIFGQGCDGLFAEVKSDNFNLLLLRETASETTTTYGNEKGFKLIDEQSKAILYLKDGDIVLHLED